MYFMRLEGGGVNRVFGYIFISIKVVLGFMLIFDFLYIKDFIGIIEFDNFYFYNCKKILIEYLC